MTGDKKIYQWSKRDRLLYALILVPFVAAFIGAAYLLSTVSPYLTFIFVLLYIMVNSFQAGCCVGCPYQGKYCPAVFGIYLANILSVTRYKKRSFEPQFFKISATLAEIALLITLLFPVYWLLALDRYYAVIYIVLMMGHAALFFPFICPRCSYNDTCPGGQFARKLFKKGAAPADRV